MALFHMVLLFRYLWLQNKRNSDEGLLPQGIFSTYVLLTENYFIDSILKWLYLE